MTRPLPDQTYLRECFRYNPRTGKLTWRTRPLHHFKNEHGWFVWNRKLAGKPAGAPLTNLSSINIGINRIHYRAHRLIWKLITGQDPIAEIDHRNNNPLDNRWNNLREATRTQNERNKNAKRRNNKKLRGAYLTPTNTYQAKIYIGRVRHYLGTFVTEQGAHAAYVEASRRLHGEFSNPGH